MLTWKGRTEEAGSVRASGRRPVVAVLERALLTPGREEEEAKEAMMLSYRMLKRERSGEEDGVRL